MYGSPKPDFLPKRINQYTPKAQYSSEVANGLYQANFGAPSVADVDFLVVDVALTSGASKTFTLANTSLISTGSNAPWGRNVTITSDAANTRTVTVTGRDYLGQPMVETIDFNGITTVSGVKAFAYIDSIVVDAEANTPTVSVGFGDVLGLPYKVVKALSEEADGVIATVGTCVAGILTDPQTATTGDPRGTYDPNTTLDGSTEITATFVVSNTINSSGNGGLYGIEQYYA